MQTKTFSVKDGTLRLENNNINLHFDGKDKTTLPLASTDRSKIDLPLYILPSTLIRKPKTDEELAGEKYPYLPFQIGINPKDSKPIIGDYHLEHRQHFLHGLKARGGEFHLTREQVNEIYRMGFDDRHIDFSNFISSLTLPIYPHTITVEHDEEKYLWETLIPSYE